MKASRAQVVVVLLILVAALQAIPAAAQTTGGVEGTVSDPEGRPLPGVTVELRSPSLQGTRIAVSAVDGRYRFPAIPPGLYTVKAALVGFKTIERSAIKVNLDATATVPLRMEISVASEIIVTGEVPVVDTTSTETGLNVRKEVVEKLPLGRNYASAVEMNPGVSLDSADTQGRALSFSIYGSTSIENQYLVDGVNTTNVIRGFQGKALTQEFVEEVQIKTGGYEAEYGRAMGGIVNVVTKSGGNEFHGDVFGYFNSKSATAARKGDATTDAPYPPNLVDDSQRDVQDFGADLGGFLLKDRIWFFAAYNRVNQNVDQLMMPDSGLPNAGENFPISYHSDLFSGKLTGRITDSTTLIAAVFGDPEQRVGALRNFTSSNPLSQQGTRDIGATDFSASLTQLFGATAIADLRYSRHQDRYQLAGQGASVGRVLDYSEDLANPTASGGFGSIRGFRDNNKSKRDAVKLAGTFFVKAHEIKAGVDYENNLTDSTDTYSGGAQLRIWPCSSAVCTGAHANDAVYYEHDFYTLSADKSKLESGFLAGGNTVSPHAYRTGFFVQDAWKPTGSLTVHVGVRYDQEDIRQYDGSKVYNQKVVDANGNVLQQGGQPFELKDEWQPRIGVAWDPSKDGSTKISASWGRFYYALPTDLTVRSYAAKVDAQTYNYSSDPLKLTQDATIGRQAAAQGGFNPEPFQDDLKGEYQDEFAIGFEKAFSAKYSLGLRYTYRNLGNVIEDRCDFDPAYPEANGNYCAIFNPGSSNPYATGAGMHTCDGRDYVDTSGNSPDSQCTGLQVTNAAIPAATRKYHGVELVLKGRLTDQFWVQASYLYSHLYGNYDGAASIAEFMYPGGGQTDPGINADFDYPIQLTNAYGNLSLDRRHSLRLDGAYTFPFGMTVGLNTFYRTGGWLSRYGYFNGLYAPEGAMTIPRGTAGQLPSTYEINLAAGYSFKLNPVTVTVILQGFNLLNKQIAVGQDQDCSIAPPTNNDPNLVGVCTAAGGNPDGANPQYGMVTWRTGPRAVKLGLRVSF